MRILNCKKAFTLIEIMMVVAIIGVLAVVLIPKIAGMKEQAMLTGIDTNLRVANGYTQVVINNYNATNLDKLELDLASKLATGIKENDIENPITHATGCYDFGNLENGAAFAYSPDILEDEVGDAMHEELGQSDELIGVIVFDAYIDDEGKVRVKFVPFDEQGNPMNNKIIEVIR